MLSSLRCRHTGAVPCQSPANRRPGKADCDRNRDHHRHCFTIKISHRLLMFAIAGLVDVPDAWWHAVRSAVPTTQLLAIPCKEERDKLPQTSLCHSRLSEALDRIFKRPLAFAIICPRLREACIASDQDRISPASRPAALKRAHPAAPAAAMARPPSPCFIAKIIKEDAARAQFLRHIHDVALRTVGPSAGRLGGRSPLLLARQVCSAVLVKSRFER